MLKILTIGTLNCNIKNPKKVVVLMFVEIVNDLFNTAVTTISNQNQKRYQIAKHSVKTSVQLFIPPNCILTWHNTFYCVPKRCTAATVLDKNVAGKFH